MMEATTANPEIQTISPVLLAKMDAYWRAANYVSVGQIYLYDNLLLREPLKLAHVKPLVVGHRGTTPGQNFRFAERLNLLPDLHWSWTASIYTAVTLVLWIRVEIVFLNAVSWLHAVYTVWAILILLVALLPQVRKLYQK